MEHHSSLLPLGSCWYNPNHRSKMDNREKYKWGILGQGAVKYYLLITHSSGVTVNLFILDMRQVFTVHPSDQQIWSPSNNKVHVLFSPTALSNGRKSCQILSLGCLSAGLQLLFKCLLWLRKRYPSRDDSNPVGQMSILSAGYPEQGTDCLAIHPGYQSCLSVLL